MAKKDDDRPDHDPDTGEILDQEARSGATGREQQQEAGSGPGASGGATGKATTRYPHDAEPLPTLDSFERLIQALEGGELNAELSAELLSLGRRMIEMHANYGGKVKGKIVLQLDFELNKGEIAIGSKVKVERPMPPRGATHFWPTGDGRISQVNPKQMDMFRSGGKPRAV